MNKDYLKKLMAENEDLQNTEPENDVLWQENFDKRFSELSKNLDETIEYLNTCTAMELSGASEVFEELSEHFKSQKLIDCVERNIDRFDDPQLQEHLKMELGYMKMYL